MIMLLKTIRLKHACEKINCIIVAEHCRRERVEVRYKKMLEVK